VHRFCKVKEKKSGVRTPDELPGKGGKRKTPVERKKKGLHPESRKEKKERKGGARRVALSSGGEDLRYADPLGRGGRRTSTNLGGRIKTQALKTPEVQEGRGEKKGRVDELVPKKRGRGLDRFADKREGKKRRGGRQSTLVRKRPFLLWEGRREEGAETWGKKLRLPPLPPFKRSPRVILEKKDLIRSMVTACIREEKNNLCQGAFVTEGKEGKTFNYHNYQGERGKGRKTSAAQEKREKTTGRKKVLLALRSERGGRGHFGGKKKKKGGRKKKRDLRFGFRQGRRHGEGQIVLPSEGEKKGGGNDDDVYGGKG